MARNSDPSIKTASKNPLIRRETSMSKSMINNRFLEETVFAIADGYCVINDTEGGPFRLFE